MLQVAYQGTPGTLPTKPYPVSFPVTDQNFSFAGINGHFYPSYTDSNLFASPALAVDSNDRVSTYVGAAGMTLLVTV